MSQTVANQRILCLWLPNWPIQRLVVAQPELRKQRIVLFSQDAHRKQMVVATSPLAQLEGVQVDTPLTEAKALLSRAACQARTRQKAPGKSSSPAVPPGATPHTVNPAGDPFFRIFQHVPQEDREALQALACEMDSYSPIVGLQTGTAQPDCIFLDITGLDALFGGENSLANQVVQFCRSLGYLVRIGVAHTIGFAQALAQHATNQNSSQVILPRQDCQSPEISRDNPAFRELPVECLRLSHHTTETLFQLGIFRIGQLLAIPRRELFSRFGNEVHHRLDQMSGEIEEPIQACPRPREFHAEQLLDHPTNHRETIEVILERLITKICQQLKSSQQGGLQWTLRLYGQHRLPVKLQVRLFAPTALPDQVTQLARMQLEQLLQPERNGKTRKRSSSSDPTCKMNGNRRWIRLDGKPLDIHEITVTVTSSVLLENRQRQLFDENPRADKQALAHLINRLSGRLGHRNVVVPSMVSGNQPEQAYQLKPLVHSGRRQHSKTFLPAHSSHALSRPVRMYHPPRPVEVVTLSPGNPTTENDHRIPSARSHSPVLLTVENRRLKVVRHWGPERIETGWWRGSLVRRDYWKVETGSNQQFWVYFDLRKRCWFLHGEF
ncbi:MAG: hypothetical protein VX768_08790 [Planctomycetota bacterium]|nr:hypothetical protein [Planctomycetota bacterium]